jgi:nitroreductase
MAARAFSRPIEELIRARSSVRTYHPRPLEDELARQLEQTLAEPPPAPFGTPVRLGLLRTFDPARKGVEKLGTYGVIRGAKDYLAGAVTASRRAMEDFGYLFEWAVLQATDLGLGTCWLGGTLQRGAFGRALGTRPEEIVPAASPVGHPADQRRFLDSAMRFFAGSDQRLPFGQLFVHGHPDRPLDPEEAGPLADPLELLRLAPSASNKQPWRVWLEPGAGRAHLFLRRNPGYGLLPGVDLQRIDLGIAMCHLALAAAGQGLAGRWQALASEAPAWPGLEYAATWA